MLVFELVGEFLLKKFQNMLIDDYFDNNLSLLCSFAYYVYKFCVTICCILEF